MVDNLFRHVLLEAQKKRKLVSVFSDPTDLDRFAVGYVNTVRDEDYTLEEIDPEGKADGISVRRIDDVLRINVEDRYTQQIALLMEHAPTIQAEPTVEEDMGIPPVDCLSTVLERAQAVTAVVSFFLDTDNDTDVVSGTVLRLSDDFVQIDALTEDGEPNGVTTLPLELISRIRVNGRDERKLALYNVHRMHLYL